MTLLFLNSLGTGEVILIMFVVLMLFGSKGIPDVVKNLGKGMKEIRNASNEIKRDIQSSALDMKKDLKMEDVLDITSIEEKNNPKEEGKAQPPVDVKNLNAKKSNDSDKLKAENKPSEPNTNKDKTA
jgi:TatA/E family protein of Tat protein translocase